MQTDHTRNEQAEQRSTKPDDFDTVEDLGRHIGRLAALIRSASNTDSENDRGWLLSMAEREVGLAEKRYEDWGLAPRGGQA